MEILISISVGLRYVEYLKYQSVTACEHRFRPVGLALSSSIVSRCFLKQSLRQSEAYSIGTKKLLFIPVLSNFFRAGACLANSKYWDLRIDLHLSSLNEIAALHFERELI